MSSLTSLLVRDQRVSVRKIEEAIQRQVIAGGDLDTVLLELDVLPENVLAAYCAVVHGLLPATRDEVMRVGRDTIRIVPREVAERHRLLPLSIEDRTLLVAVDQPLESEVDQQLSFLLGADIVQRVVPSVRIAAALQHHYGVEMVPRMRRLANKLREKDAGEVPFVAPLEQNTMERPEASPGEYSRDVRGEDDEDDDEGQRARFGVVKAAPVPGNEGAVRVGVAQVVGVRRSAPPPRPSSLPPAAAPGTVSSVAPAAPTVLSQPPPARVRRVSEPESELLRKLRGPLTTKRVIELMSVCEERDEILEVAFAFVRQFFDFTALFVVHEGEAEGLDCAGPGALSVEAFQRVTVALDEPSAFSVAAESAQPVMTHLDGSAADRDLRGKLRREAAAPGIILPIPIRRRVVLFFYGDRSGEAFTQSDLPELLAFGPKLSESFQQLILRRKFRGYSKGTSTGEASETVAPSAKWAAPEPVSKSFAPPPREEPVVRSRAEHSGAERPATPAKARAPEAQPTRADTVPEMPAVRSAPLLAAEGRSTHKHPVVPPPDRQTPVPPLVGTAPVSGPTTAPEPAGGPTELLEEEELDPSPDVVLERRRRRRKRSQVLDALGVPRSAPPPPRPGSQPEMFTPPADEPVEGESDDDDEPELVVAEDDGGLGDLEIDEEELEDGDSIGAYRVRGGSTEVVRRGAPRAPVPRPSRRDPRREEGPMPMAEIVRIGAGVTPAASPASLQPRPPGERPSVPVDPSPDTPSVIVSMGENVEEAVADLLTVGPEDDSVAQRVLNLGEAALPVLVREFPGTLWFDRNRPHRRLPRGRDISPHARVLASFGERAVPYIASLLDHKDADARFYATLVASEVPSRDLVVPLGRRVFDEDLGVASLAIDVLRMMSHHASQLEKVIEMLRAAARVPRYAPNDRAAAARALGEFRDQKSVELLIHLLHADHEELKGAAHDALVVITRQDFGAAPKKWEEWAEQHGNRHRIEWLIESLMHPDEKMRGVAAEELKAITQQYYGYHPAHPKKQREVAHKKYLDWWVSVGQRRFNAAS